LTGGRGQAAAGAKPVEGADLAAAVSSGSVVLDNIRGKLSKLQPIENGELKSAFPLFRVAEK
jgi:hypothetical protein